MPGTGWTSRCSSVRRRCRSAWPRRCWVDWRSKPAEPFRGHRRPRSMRRLAVVAMLAALAACAAPGTRVPAGAPEIHPSWTSCDDEVADPNMAYGADALELPMLGAGIEPVAVVVCGMRDLKHPDGALDLVATESRGEDIDALLAALRLPDQPLTAGGCTADLPTVP